MNKINRGKKEEKREESILMTERSKQKVASWPRPVRTVQQGYLFIFL